MSLEKYQAKRRFDRTPEPLGKVERGAGDRFVIHKHDASHLHYDLRLEMNGVLKSWAVPKEPPRVKGIKRLAVMVEDHPCDYLDFEGVIPEGNYGAGRVEVWDKGIYSPITNDQDTITKLGTSDSFKFKLNGKKLKGEYALVHLKDKPSASTGRGNWLFFKTK